MRVFREVNKPQGGHLFVITSLVGLKSMTGTGFYSATKHGQACSCQVARDPSSPLRLPLGDDAVGLGSGKSADLSDAALRGAAFSEAVEFNTNRVI